MTYTDWRTSHDDKVKVILDRLENEGYNKEDVVKYFEFENMVEKEPSFCLLYAEKKKCHDIPNLNCLYCACPYFKFNEDGLRELDGNRMLMSDCTIGSRFSGEFAYDGKVHCDCTNCHIPHSKGFAMHACKSGKSVDDSYSFLQYLRSYQLGKVLGKYKLFD
jgi:hypothetical protein